MEDDPCNPRDALEISPQARDAFSYAVKKELRKRMRGLRAALPASAVHDRSARIVDSLCALPWWHSARSVGLFWPIEGRNETDVRSLFQRAQKEQKHICYPSIDASTGVMVLRYVARESELAERGYGFLEPPADALEAGPGMVDLIVVPAVALDPYGHRIGYGAGFYDRMLPGYVPPALAVGVAFDFQLITEVAVTVADVPVQRIVTDARVLEVGALESPPELLSAVPSQQGTKVIPRPRR